MYKILTALRVAVMKLLMLFSVPLSFIQQYFYNVCVHDNGELFFIRKTFPG